VSGAAEEGDGGEQVVGADIGANLTGIQRVAKDGFESLPEIARKASKAGSPE
jgi:hypothetical protein